MSTIRNIAGLTFGRLTAIRFIKRENRLTLWLCRCDCGREKVLSLTRLLAKDSNISCGNHVLETRHRTHGRSKTPEYKIWCSMVARCTNPNSQVYQHYGARGITVCERWKNSFENFLADMGERPPNLTLERKDNNASYTPDNCIWADRKAQQRNKSDTHMLTLRGITKSLPAWADELGCLAHTLRSRLRYGWSEERTLTEPILKRNRTY